VKKFLEQCFCKHNWQPVPMSKRALEFWKKHDCLGCFYYHCPKCDKYQLKNRNGTSKYLKATNVLSSFPAKLSEIMLPHILIMKCSLITKTDIQNEEFETYSFNDLTFDRNDLENLESDEKYD